jgi:hypothetical protein
MAEPGQAVGLPPRPFLYTLDQVAYLIQIEESTLRRSYLHYEGRSVGAPARGVIVTRNIAPVGLKPEWRVAERELVRFMKFKGFRYHERGWITEQRTRSRRD